MGSAAEVHARDGVAPPRDPSRVRGGFWGVTPPPANRAGAAAQGFALRSLGARGYAAYTEGGPTGGDPSFGGQLYERAFGYVKSSILTARYADSIRFGGDGGGLAYGAEVQAALGARWPWDEHQGPLARVGFRGQVLKEATLRSSDLRLPELQLGYSWVSRRLTLDVAAHSSYVPMGLHRLEGARRSLRRTAMAGAYLGLGTDRAWWLAEYSRTWGPGDDELRPHEDWRLETCIFATPAAFCLDLRWLRSWATRSGIGRATDQSTLGLGVLFGQMSALE